MIKRIFPNGTNDGSRTHDTAPKYPPDVFAVAAFLLERSGLYAYLVPGERHLWAPPWFHIEPYEKSAWKKVAEAWKESPALPKVVQDLWNVLWRKKGNQYFSTILTQSKPFPDWVKAAYGLMYIADEACSDVGHFHSGLDIASANWIALIPYWAEVKNIIEEAARQSDSRHVRVRKHRYSITKQASPDMLSVLPKANTAQVGLTMRAISQNLALLPPSSRMAATWNRISGNTDQPNELNILLIPFPYEIRDSDIVENDHGAPKERTWGWFSIEQNWLPKDQNKDILLRFVKRLIEKSQSETQKLVDIIIFPELSLDWDNHNFLVNSLSEDFPSLEFIISGSSTNCNDDVGNFVLTSSITSDANGTRIYTNSRAKHHRWRLDEGQIDTYDLSKSLGPHRSKWWEEISIPFRLVHTNVFRKNTSFITFICEDLARSDPAHETIRAIGPSIVFCLLMDGPQLTTRWSARYSLGLVEDPGSSVLTFTSRGLSQRTRDKEVREAKDDDPQMRSESKAYPMKEAWSVALWRDHRNKPMELHCPPPDHAVFLQLVAEDKQDLSYDGRASNRSVTWIYKSSCTVRVPEDDDVRALRSRSFNRTSET